MRRILSRTRGAWLALCLTAACSRPTLTVGEPCQLNSDCADPLACVLGACRRQCVTPRDCGAGLSCFVSASSTLGGGCQLQEEAVCTLTSECRAHDPTFVCRNGTCTTPCLEDRDCAPGAQCNPDAMTGTLGCYDTAVVACIYNSDCPDPMICDRDQSCRLECIGDRDCIAPRVCRASRCELPDASSAVDAGP